MECLIPLYNKVCSQLEDINNRWSLLSGYKEFVISTWNSTFVSGDPLYCLLLKLKRLKGEIRSWTEEACPDLHKAIVRTKDLLDAVQTKVGTIGIDDRLQREENELLKEYNLLKQMEKMEIQQKAEEEWMIMGGKCSRHFHKLLKARESKAAICEIENEEGDK